MLLWPTVEIKYRLNIFTLLSSSASLPAGALVNSLKADVSRVACHVTLVKPVGAQALPVYPTGCTAPSQNTDEEAEWFICRAGGGEESVTPSGPGSVLDVDEGKGGVALHQSLSGPTSVPQRCR
ncbi:hypothetical protein EYF80_024917 [Liparis tanakae]|uniref:Uncharacterized protein n=1 Tax=Liparis tanakae TaxID=230148 RepID=A0A4Z2HGG8_9TELE|nr:hypothetical protein EYF80_024917 [Liparis tanakae]